MSPSRIESLKVKAKLLQKAKRKAGKPIQLKDALNTIARAAGSSSWRELKDLVEANQAFAPGPGAPYWHTWYASYEEALKHLATNPALYLLPHEKHFFVCDEHYIRHLGLEPNDADLAKVGNDWAQPRDFEAWKRCLTKIRRA